MVYQLLKVSGDSKWQPYFYLWQQKADPWLPAWQQLLKVSDKPWFD